MAMIRETAADEERDWLLVAASALSLSLSPGSFRSAVSWWPRFAFFLRRIC
jgi:hypothetical protein